MKQLLFILLVINTLPNYAQEKKYWVFLKDKNTENYDYSKFLSPQTIQNRQNQGLPLFQYTDIPLNTAYLGQIENEKVQILGKSRWLNALSAELNAEQIAKLKAFSFVIKIQEMGKPLKALDYQDFKEVEYSKALAQIGTEVFAKAGLNGTGIGVGIIDAGFYGASHNDNLSHIFQANRMMAVRDFVNPKRKNLFDLADSESDNHGTMVWQMIAGWEQEGTQYGFATGANFWLARSENGSGEKRVEEDYWVLAMEWLDSAGVRVINTSLGYALGFDDPKENYKPEQMDGKTSVISRAAQIAIDEKGILLVVSAGNEGSDDWEIISTPADTEGAISVGATDASGMKMYYSSIGPSFLPYQKPNVACYATSGTSFSAPVITGFAACLLQADQTRTNKEIFEIIQKSGHLYPFGNNYIGYGVPQAQAALGLLKNEEVYSNKDRKQIESKEEVFNWKLKKDKTDEDNHVVLFHKKDSRTVVKQDTKILGSKNFQIKREKGASQTTAIYGDQVLEIIWK